jgi:hypothetical protein
MVIVNEQLQLNTTVKKFSRTIINRGTSSKMILNININLVVTQNFSKSFGCHCLVEWANSCPHSDIRRKQRKQRNAANRKQAETPGEHNSSTQALTVVNQ